MEARLATLQEEGLQLPSDADAKYSGLLGKKQTAVSEIMKEG